MMMMVVVVVMMMMHPLLQKHLPIGRMSSSFLLIDFLEMQPTFLRGRRGQF
jgi:hypothetical protein